MTTRRSGAHGGSQEGAASVADQARANQVRDQAAEIARLNDQVTQLQKEVEETANRHLRLAADFENYKRRARQEQMETIQYGSTEIILRLLPVLDDLRMALDHAPMGLDEGWLRGVRLTLQKLEEVLAGQGVTPIEAIGTPFDPGLHEAVGHEETTDQPEDTVVEELRRGYRLHDRVVRPSLVKVARPALPSA